MLKVGVDKQGLAFIEASGGGAGCQSHAPAFKQCAVKIEPATDQLAAAAANVAARSY